LYESKESLCSAVFSGSKKLKITPLDRPGSVYYLTREDPQSDGHFTFKSVVTIFNALDCKVCETCVLRDGERVGNVNISYLCQNCQEEAPNSFVLKKGDKNYLVVSDSPEALVSIEISRENVTKKNLQFNLLDNLVPRENVAPTIELVTNELERSFVEFCFESSKLPGN
jgi:hypothetical protein